MKLQWITRLTWILTVVMATLGAVQPRLTAQATGSVYVDIANNGHEDGSQAHPYNSIQEGILAAFSGDTVLVAPGIYLENVTLPRSKPGISLVSQAGPDATIIDGQFRDSVVTILDSATIDGFTIRYASGPGSRDTGYGIAVNADGTTDMKINIHNNIVVLNIGRGGIGINSNIYPTKVTATISRNRITQNSGVLGGEGGGISLNLATGNPGAITIANNVIYHNAGTFGGGLSLGTSAVGYGAITVVNNTVYSNSAWYGGGAVGNSSNISLINNIFFANTADYNGNDLYLIQLGLSAQVINNLISDGQYAGTDGNFVADPLMVDAPSGDFHLRSHSPAIDAGASNTVLDDFDGDARPFDAPCGQLWDIGADEYYPSIGNQLESIVAAGGRPQPPQVTSGETFVIYLPIVLCG